MSIDVKLTFQKLCSNKCSQFFIEPSGFLFEEELCIITLCNKIQKAKIIRVDFMWLFQENQVIVLYENNKNQTTWK